MADVLMAYRARVAGGALTRDPAQDAAAVRLDALAEHLRKWNPDFWFSKPPRGLYIWGAVGRGKSMLMDLFYEHAPGRKKQRVHFHEFMQARHIFLRRARAARDLSQDDLIAEMAKDVADDARLLCFDEIQISDIADAMILGRLFEHLFARNVVIVATGNRPPDDFYKNGINRQLFLPFVDLFKEKLDIVELKAERDFRLERLMAAPVYYAPLGPAAKQAMDSAWARLTHGAKPQATSFDVHGRRVEAPRTAAGCARFTFAELCERPLGPADYLELADRFNTIMIDDIPFLTPDNREAAARLRILVDALYEAKAKLVCSAAAEPAALYPEGAQSFEFERTASRLMEMRSKDYLATPRPDREAPRAMSAQ
jgi:cell division protein ZapE